jgi:ElaB/YqjD/DUF883 family membrane-anchored ribosome-binding protein
MTDPTSTMTPPGATEQQSSTEQVKEQVSEQVQQVAGQAKEQARNVADQARSQVDERSTQYGQKVTEHASSIRSVADHLRTQGKESEAKYAEQAAEKIERAGSWLTESDADRILREVEDFGRQRPWAVIGAGIALGVAASRMLKASSTQRYESGRSPSTPPSPSRGLPQGTGLQPDTTPAVPTTPRTDSGTWGGNGNL